MNYTNLLRAMTDAAEALTKSIAQGIGTQDAGRLHNTANLLNLVTASIAAIETATRPQPSGMGITSADARAILDALASLRRAGGGG